MEAGGNKHGARASRQSRDQRHRRDGLHARHAQVGPRLATRGEPRGDRRCGPRARATSTASFPISRAEASPRISSPTSACPILRLSAFIPMGGATCVAAIQTAAMAVATGVCKNVLISVGRTGYSGATGQRALAAVPAVCARQRVRGADRHVRAGPALRPGRAAPHAALRHDGAALRRGRVVTTRNHAILNGNVVMNKPLTVEEHHASRMISDPFRLFDCSLESDGGAAIDRERQRLARSR
jgi:hypothetical protein